MALVTLTIDGQALQVEAGTNLIEAAKTLKNNVPHYCYHPGLEPVGNCRMCLVQVDKISKPVIACMTPAAEGMVVYTDTPEVKKMRQSVMEFLLINHPLDCPTCDQAGECRLQDYYMQYDVTPSRFQEEKVHKNKMVDLGAGVMLDEERCIVCTRCVRFCQEVAHSEELDVQARGNHSMVTTFPGKKMTHAYAGNTVDVCPVGALTSIDFRYKKRVWLLSSADSICTGCARGCNITIDHADDRLYRLKPRFNADVNQYWMCDEGRYGYRFVNDKRRLKPALRRDGVLQEVSVEDAVEHFQDLAISYKKGETAFVASAEESNESIDAFIQMAREIFDAGEVYFSKNDPKNPSSDDILIKADKNPNLAHVQKQGLKNISEFSSHVKALVVQRRLSEDDLKFVAQKKVKVLALFATNLTPEDEMAETIFPVTTFAEAAGHVTNFEGRVQSFAPAFAPRGESKEMWEYFSIFKQSSRDGNFKSQGFLDVVVL